jgi:pyruvate dehydrogenase E2 component (dihydrolipoamide acetyltransferase)
MPQAGNTMEEGTVVNWQIKEGETITVGQIICEIETDKATIDFESPEAGRVARIVAPVGEPIAVKEPIALLAESDADADAFLAASQRSGESAYAASSSTPSVSPQVVARSAPVTTSGRVKASPAARKLAGQRGVELAAVAVGSGPGGRILRADVEHAEIATSANADDPPGCRRTPMSKMRRAIGLNLQASKQNVPHFYVRRTIDADPLLAFHADRKEATAATLNHVIVLAVGKAIGEFPEVRSQIAGNDVIEFPHANIGVAVAVDDGLVVPVVLAVDTMTLAELATETKRIVDNARQGRLDNIGKGNFTISNLGMFGVDEFSAIINPPESGILAVSAIRETVVAEKGAVRAGRTMMLTLSADHRVVDGVVAAKFMARLKEILEHPADELA